MKNTFLLLLVALALLVTVNLAQANLADGSEAIASNASEYYLDSDIAFEQALPAAEESATATEDVTEEPATVVDLEQLNEELLSIIDREEDLTTQLEEIEALESPTADDLARAEELRRALDDTTAERQALEAQGATPLPSTLILVGSGLLGLGLLGRRRIKQS